MTKISVYNIDEYVTGDDKWIGTDVNTYNKTKNFTPKKLSNYFNGSQVINTGVDLLYKYFTITPPETRPTGTLSFETEIGQTVNFSAISTFLLSKTTLKGNDVVEFLNFLVGSNSLIYKAKNINLFGSYKIVSIEEYLPEPNFLVVNVEFIEGNGFIEEDEDYMISIIDINSSEIQDLQNVTDIGNTTTNSIIANSFVKIGGIGNNVLLDNGTTIPINTIGNNQDLQQVTDLGAETTNSISIFPIGNNKGLQVEVLGNQPAIVSDSINGDGIQAYSFSERGVLAYSQTGPGLWAESRDSIPIKTFGNGIGTPSVEVNLGNSNKGLVINSGASSTGNFIELDKNGVDKLVVNQEGELTATKLIKQGGTSTQFLKADGSVDSTTYTTAQNLQQVTDLGATTTNTISVFVNTSGDNGVYSTTLDGYSFYASSISGSGLYAESTSGGALIAQSESGYGISCFSGGSLGLFAGSSQGVGASISCDSGKGIEVYGNGTVSIEANLGNSNNGLVINSGASSSGKPIVIDKNGVEKLVVNQEGELTATKLIKEGGTSAQLLAANGDTITAGTNITINGGQISSTGGSGGGISVNLYLNGSIASSVAGYRQIGTTAIIGAGTDFSLTGNGTIAQFLTDVGSPNRLEIPSGAWNFELWLQAGINNSSTKVHVDLYKYDGAFTLIASGSSNPINLQTNTNTNLYVTNVAVPQTTLLVTDRLAVRVIASNSIGSHIVTLHTENGNICEILTNFVGGVAAINGITQPSQTLATGTTGTNFAIVSSGSTHTFNLPDASTTARGVVTVNDQQFSGLKNFTDNIIVNTIRVWRGNNNSGTNIGIGLDTLIDNTGNQNTVLGYQAVSSALSASSFTTAVGYQSLKNIPGNNNTAVGHTSGLLLTGGAQNVFIGSQAGGITGQLINATNSIAIGYQAITTKNNQVVLGNSLITETVLNGKILIDLPTTSAAGTYSFLTRNTTSGFIEKVLSTSVQTAITLGVIGSSPNVNGATLTTGGSLVLQPASGAFGGVITTGAQTIAGNKTFTGTIAGITKTMVGLSNVDNTSDIGKPISTATQTALNLKVDSNTAIIGDTKTKITYDSKGLVTAGADITTTDLSDFNSASRAQTEAALVAGSNITITPAGTGDTRTLTIASTGAVSQNAFTILANNTNASAVPTEQTYKDIVQQSLSNTGLVWSGTTAPSGTNNHTYKWSQIGKLVTVRVNLNYTVFGSALTSVAIPFDNMPDLPIPATVTGFTANGEVINFGNGLLTTSKGIPVFSTLSMGTSLIRRNLAGTGTIPYDLCISRNSSSYQYAFATIQYYTT